MINGFACSQCRNKEVISKFPPEIVNFAMLFVAMQLKRHNADYNPYSKFYKSEVENDREAVATAIKDMEACDLKDRRAFASWVLVKKR